MVLNPDKTMEKHVSCFPFNFYVVFNILCLSDKSSVLRNPIICILLQMSTGRPITITLQELRFCRNKIIILCHIKQQLRQRLDSYRFQNHITAIDNEITILKRKVVILNERLVNPIMHALSINLISKLLN